MMTRWRQWRRAVLWGVFFSTSYNYAHVIVLDYTRDGARAFEQVPERMTLAQIQVRVDVPVDQHYIRDLMCLREGSVITRTDLAQAGFYLAQWGRFRSIQFLCEPGKGGMQITVRLQARWLFAHLTISGIWLGKDDVRKRYELSAGEPFDQRKHAQSLKRLLKYYHKHGYLNATIKDTFLRDASRKLVTVALRVDPGRLCTMRKIVVQYTPPPDKKELNQYTWTETLRTYAQRTLLHYTYKKYRIKQVEAYMREWLAQRGFPFAQIRVQHAAVRGGVTVTFFVKVLQTDKVELIGNHAITTKQLIDYALYDVHGQLHDSAMPLFAHRIREWYKKQGYLVVQVTPKHAHHWRLLINEGPRVQLSQVRLLGVSAARVSYVQALAANLLRKSVTSHDDIATLMDRIIDWYVVRGFWDARIDDKSLVVDVNKHCQLQLTIHEGEQRMLKAVHIAQYPALEQQGPFGLLHEHNQPVPFNRALLDEQRHWLAKKLAKDGVHVRALTPLLQEQTDGVTVTWQVDHDERRALCGRTIITGMPGVTAGRLIRDCACHEGEPLDMHRLEKTFYQLREWGIFNSLSVRPSLQLDCRGQTPVVINAVADDPFELQARIGGLVGNTNRSSTYVLGATAWWKNPTGQADNIRFDVNATRFNRDLLLGYGFAQVAGVPARVNVALFDKKYDHLSYGLCRCVLYRAYESGGRLTITYRHDPLLFGLSVAGTALKINVINDAYARAICFEPSLNRQREPYVFIEPYVELQYTDEKLNPTKGVAGAAQVTVGVPLLGTSDTFVRLFLKQSLFMPLGSSFVFAVHGQVGHVIIDSFKRLLPSQRFYLGGACSVRSYQEQAADPVSCYHDQKTAFFVPTGSASMGLVSAEVRASITQKISAVLFQDFGALKQPAGSHWCPASATGFGIRYRTPVGPLRFDIAWKAKKSKADCAPCAWYLTLGHAF